MYLPRVIRPHPPTSGTSDGTMAIREQRSEPSMTITCLVYSAGFFLGFSPRILVTVRSLVGHMYRSRSRQQKKGRSRNENGSSLWRRVQGNVS
jgi:hypothetical protein